ncbi:MULTISPECIES: TetR/AcrR family transcriptional regulator [unclassified Pseudofrankia]|uniref:TetR/AcrR family transcriptional regulator n=1 Tax=unclassified Pseudofrankia TaxID=2994372 RepID=UPI0008D90136|nr:MULTISPECIES: TetR/AcrR family transcriptional regulator [unclassified Pseudofrankia]MDT3439751.1 TetR/AcrR family transcriptional regulator [Pseudofrankia sp. BMG5.37]OHV44811.1 TetR family transcriptional regulator [Pseudofrankia sp. BMG5.36]
MARGKAFDPDTAVDKAMEVFWANGYAHTTPQQLVDALGIGRGSLYNAFTSKRALFERALRRYHEREAVQIIRVLDGSGPPRERLRAALDLVVTAALSDDKRRGCMMANTAVEFGDGDEPINHLVRRTFDRQEAAFRSAIEEGQRSGDIDRAADAGALAALFLATINGIRVLGKADPNPQRLAGLADTLLRSL